MNSVKTSGKQAGSDTVTYGVSATGIGYRADVDGLRCIAVLLVVAYHVFPKAVRGGFSGVDVFFVISGYLITSILIREMRNGTYSIFTFYARRIRRIFPALILVLGFTFIAAWQFLSPLEFLSLGWTMFGGASFSANIVLFTQSGYFDILAENKPLLHLWSLGVEEQFYIVWPFMLLFAFRARLNFYFFIWVIILASFILNIAIVHRHAEQAFFLPFTRAWELAIGASFVFWQEIKLHRSLTQAISSLERFLNFLIWDKIGRDCAVDTLSNVRSILGVALIFTGAFVIKSGTPYPGIAALLPVGGAILLISSETSVFNRRILSHPVLVFLGLISYPLYLWHYPLVVFTRLYSGDKPSVLALCGVIVASILLAWLTYILVEKQFRFAKLNRFKIVLLCMLMTIMGAIGLLTVWQRGFESRLPEEVRNYVLFNEGSETSAFWRAGKCLLGPDQDASQFAAECSGDGKRPLILLWGDSYAASMYPGIDRLRSEVNFSVAEFTASACPPAVGFVHPQRIFCKGANDFVLKKVRELRPEIVLLKSTWSYDLASLEERLSYTAGEMKLAGVKRIALVGPAPGWSGRSLPQNLVDYYMSTTPHTLLPKRTKFRLAYTSEFDDRMQALANRLGIEYISAWKVFCNDQGCLARVGDTPHDLAVYDTGHLTVPGSVFLAQAIKHQLFPDIDFKSRQSSPPENRPSK